VKKNYMNGSLHDTVTSWTDSYETKVTGATTEQTTYYFVNNELVAKKNPDGSKYYFHNDHLGSTRVLTNSGGTLVEETKYDPWGEVNSGGTKSKFLYTGQEKDPETNLNYYNARYYDSHIRRFTQPDDIIQNVYNPQDLNRYSYVRNNPMKYTDPTGHYAETPIDIMLLSIDIHDLQNDPSDPWNWAALAGDSVGAVTPGLTGVGLGIKAVKHGDDIAKGLNKTDAGKNVQNVVKQNTANNAKNSINLSKSLASQQQMAETGTIIAGPGSKIKFNDAPKTAQQLNAKVTELVKKTSSSFRAADGTIIQTHWVENIKTGVKDFFKSVIKIDNKQKK
jgi:RHS repeat-associated protein